MTARTHRSISSHHPCNQACLNAHATSLPRVIFNPSFAGGFSANTFTSHQLLRTCVSNQSIISFRVIACTIKRWCEPPSRWYTWSSSIEHTAAYTLSSLSETQRSNARAPLLHSPSGHPVIISSTSNEASHGKRTSSLAHQALLRLLLILSASPVPSSVVEQ